MEHKWLQKEAATNPDDLVDFSDYDTVRQNLFDSVQESVTKAFPIENERYTLSLADVKYSGPERFSLKDQKQAILEGRTLGRKLVGKWHVTDNATKQVLSKSNQRTVMNVPYLTNRGTYIRNGTEYTAAKQFRLSPGVYSRVTDDGNVEAQFNIRPRTGMPFRVFMEPSTSVFYMRYGGRKVPLYPIMRAMGYQPKEVQALWGEEIFKKNQEFERSPYAVNFLQQFLEKEEEGEEIEKKADTLGDDYHSYRKNILENFNKMELDPDSTTTTLGRGYTNVTPEAIMLATNKILKISRQQADPDDRDSLEFQTVHDTGDFLTEKIKNDQNGLMRQLMWKITNKMGDHNVIPSGVFDKHVSHFFNNSGLAQGIEEINPMDMYDQNQRVVRLGEGGISSLDAVPKEARNVQPSYANFVDPVRAPESMKIGVDMKFAQNVRKGKDGLLYTEFIDPKTNKKRWVNMRQASRSIIGFPDSLKSKDKFVPAMVKAKGIEYVDRSTIDFVIPTGEDMFSDGANTVPMKSGVKAMRLLMGSKFGPQALPLVTRQAPFVQTMSDKGMSTEKKLGKHMGAMHSPKAGVVTAVRKDRIEMAYDDGTTGEVEVYDNFPFSRKTFIRNTPVVKAGDKVGKNGLLATSNFTDDKGVSALGTNMRVAYLNFDGKVFEDAIVISESAAKTLTSEHMYHDSIETDKEVSIGKEAYRSLYPGKYSKKQLGTIGDNGVVKKGTTLHFGDPLFLAVRQRDASKSTMGRKLRKEESTTWQHHFPGIVTDAVKTKKGFRINARANVPMQQGDKLANRFGGKGVISEVIPDDKMPLDSKGRPFEVLLSPLGIISRCYDEQTEFLTPEGWKYGKDVVNSDKLLCFDTDTWDMSFQGQTSPFYSKEYKGELITTGHPYIDFALTPGHTMYAHMDHGGSPNRDGGVQVGDYWKTVPVDDVEGKRYYFPSIGKAVKQEGDLYFDLPQIEYSKKDTQSYKGPIEIESGDWAEFLGWYLSEGHSVYSEERRQYSTCISQDPDVHSDNWDKIDELLDRLPFNYHWNKHNNTFVIGGKRLASYCKQFGLCDVKYAPNWLFSQSSDTLHRFIDSMMRGDGYYGTTNTGITQTIGLTSKQLIEDMQRAFLLTGTSAIVRDIKVREGDKPMWRCAVQLHKKNRLMTKSHWERKEYEGMVYCPTVPTGFVMTRRNGKLLIAGNTNSAQLVEAGLGKISAKTGKHYVLPGFTDNPDDNLVDFVAEELKKNNLSDTETLRNPATGKDIKEIFTGNSYFYKMQHTSEGKGKSRSTAGYTQEEQPSRGGKQGAKHIGDMEIQAILSHGTSAVLKDLKIVKGQKNDNFWRQLKLGQTPVAPGTPLVYEKFKSLIRASGVDLREGKDSDNIFAMTNERAKALTGDRKLENSSTYAANNMRPLPGGLFDPKNTGSDGDGDRWSYIQLPEPLPNPVMEDPIRAILGMTQKQFREAVSEPGEGSSVSNLLDKMDLKVEKRRAMDEIKGGARSKRDAAIKRFNYIDAMEKQGVKPTDFLMTRVPVLPPRFRPITKQNDMTMVADANYMYKALMDSSQDYVDTSDLPDDMRREAKDTMYQSYKALIGLTDPVQQKLQQKNVGGLIEQIFGKGSPKCYDSQTEVLTEQGFIPFPEYVGQSPVATVHPLTHALQFHMPDDIIHEDYEGDMVEFDMRKNAKLLVTPNHRNWVKYRGAEEWKFERADISEDKASRTYMLMCPASFKGSVALPKGYNQEDGVFAELVGWWLAEGAIHSDRHAAEIYQTDFNPEYCERLDKLAALSGIRFSKYTYPATTRTDGYTNNHTEKMVWSFQDKDLVQWLSNNIGEGSHNKRLSRAILGWSSDNLKALLRGYLAGDGNKSTSIGHGRTQVYNHEFYRWDSFSTTSKGLIEDLTELGCRIGVGIKYRDWQPRENGYPVHRAVVYKTNAHTNEGKECKKYIPYTGQVHCVTVPNGLIVVRRNGHTFVSGNSGFVQRRVIGTNIDVSGLSVVTPNPSLKMDEVGLPEELAWGLYEPFIIRHMVQNGVPATVASQAVADKTKQAYGAMQSVIKERPVLVNRAPSLHKYNIMAFQPVLTKGHTLQVPPAIVKGFAMDFDGDTASYSVPVSKDAVEEAYDKMMPSKNLIGARDDKPMYMPSNEYLQGLYFATKKPNKKSVRKFATREDASKAYKRGEISVDDPIVILHEGEE